MERISYVLNIHLADQQEYIERHQAVYPELLKALKDAGVHKYSIFMYGGILFAYMEVDNFEKAMEEVDRNEANQRWQQFMSDLLITNHLGTKIEVIPEVFHLE